MKIIILIIASDDADYYLKMQDIWKKYMNTNSNIKSYFIKFSNYIKEDVELDDFNNTIWIKGEETYIPGILDKTIKSYKYLIDNNIEFDYVLRTNLSTVVILDNLYEFLNENHIEYGGSPGILRKQILTNKIYCKELLLIDDSNKFYPFGTSILLSKNSIITLLSQNINYNIIDDVSIGLTLSKIYKFTPIRRQNITKYNKHNKYEVIKEPDLFFYRCKNGNEHLKTIDIMNHIVKIFYNK